MFVPVRFLVATTTLAVSAIAGATVGYIHNQSALPDPQPVVSTDTRATPPSFTRTPTKPSPSATAPTQDNGMDHDQARDPRLVSKPHDPSHPKKVVKTKATKAATATTRLAPQSDEPVDPTPETPAGEDIAQNKEPVPVTDPSQQPVKPQPQETTPPPAPHLPNQTN